ncbi:endoplasmic reticulum protein [Trypanosoma theileri]|uniref:Endoplasmic reticulum protein n=1 Tax=Trypanosoma theileri TaxID=67003 RepID=A0A1X0NJQ7_9TRYP|nr:endoplasmic reticulum protein [Trypanosoma theileri]ORC84340.1 endoplasmic reticulum protein [Trypanosoma theileri]
MFGLTRCRQLHVTAEQVAAVVRAKLGGSPAVENTLLVDVRSTGEVAATGVIPTAVNIPLKMLDVVLSDDVDEEEFVETFGIPKPQKGITQMVFYCAHGVRSSIATEIAEGLGYSGTRNFTGSFSEWQDSYGKSIPAESKTTQKNP